MATCTLVHSSGTKTLALFSTNTCDHKGLVGKSSKGVSVSVVKLSLPTLRLSKSALKYVPAAPALSGQPILKPPDTTKEYYVKILTILKGTLFASISTENINTHILYGKTK